MYAEHEWTSEYDETTPVLIVGGGLVGLSTSLFLAWHGVPSLLVERHIGISPHPRAARFNPRTMELFRAAGVERAIRQAEPSDYLHSSVLRAESLAGKELGWVTLNSTENVFSPAEGSFIGQDELEPILRTHAEELGSELRFFTECSSFEQDDQGVTAVIGDRKTGKERVVRARYLIAADGKNSAIRKQLSINVHGPGTLANQLSILFSADLGEALHGRHIATCFVNNPLVRGGTLVLARERGQGFALYAHYHPETGEREEDFYGARGVELVRGAIGLPDLPVEIISVNSWEAAAWVAEGFQRGNVFLVGDAAHVMPPAGAFGANTGIADPYNLAWKMALVIKGKADPALLATYSSERRPVARFTAEQAVATFTLLASSSGKPVAPASAQATQSANYDAAAFGYRYHSAIVPSDAENEEWYEDPYHPTGSPGTHAPHVTLEENGRSLSTLDLFGQHFVLLTGADGHCWRDSAQRTMVRLGLAIDCYTIGDQGNDNIVDVHNRFLEAYGILSDGAVLVRPDGFVGWKAATTTDRPELALEEALASLLCRSTIVR